MLSSFSIQVKQNPSAKCYTSVQDIKRIILSCHFLFGAASKSGYTFITFAKSEKREIHFIIYQCLVMYYLVINIL